MLWTGEVEDAKRIDDFITSALITGRPILDFKNPDFKTATGLRKNVAGNFKRQDTTAEGKAQSEKMSFTGRHNAWTIYDVFKNSGDNEAILNLRDLSKNQ